MTSLVDDLTFDIFDFDASKFADSTGQSSGILTSSANQNIALQEEQLAKIAELTQPFRDAATDTALPQLSALAFGGDIDYQPSQIFSNQLSSGRQDILKQQSGGGAGIKSSNTFEKFSDLVSGAASDDIGRFEQGQTSLLNQGLTATNQLGQAGSSTAGNISGIYSNLGQGLNLNQQQLAQAQQAGAQGLSSGISGLAKLALSF